MRSSRRAPRRRASRSSRIATSSPSRRQEQLFEVGLDLAKDRVEAADGLLEDPDPSSGPRAHAPRSSAIDEVEDRHGMLLADAVEAADALLDFIGFQGRS